jgi:TP901 family phage tail tape measure protein
MSTSALKPLILKIGADIKELQQGLAKAEKETKTFGDTVGKFVGPAIGLALAKVGKDAIGMAVDFNKAMGAVETLIPGNTQRIEQLSDSVEDLALATGKGATDIADGLFQVVSAFGDGADSADILKVAVRGATAGLATTESAVNLLSGVMKGYNDVSAESAQKTSDLAFLTNKLGQTTFPELAASMGNVVPIASTLGVAQEELFGIMATLTGVTGNTAEVSTQLKAALSNLLKPNKDLQKIYKELNVESAEQLIRSEGLVGTFNLLQEATEGSNAKLGKLFKSTEGLNAIFALTGSQADNFTEKFAQMQNASGSAEEAFTAFTQGINKTGFEMEVAQQKIEALMREIGEELLPVIADLLPLVDSGVKLFSSLTPIIKSLGPVITAAGQAFGMLAEGIGEVLEIAEPLLSIFGELEKAGKQLGDAIGNDLANIFANTNARQKEVNKAYDAFVEKNKDALAAVEAYANSVEGAAARTKQLGESAKKTEKEIDKLGDSDKKLKPIETSLDKINEEFKKMKPLLMADINLFNNQAFIFHRQAIEGMIEQYRILGQELPTLLKKAQDFFNEVEESNRIIDKNDKIIGEWLDTQAQGLDEVITEWEDFGPAVDGALDGVQDAIDNFEIDPETLIPPVSVIDRIFKTLGGDISRAIGVGLVEGEEELVKAFSDAWEAISNEMNNILDDAGVFDAMAKGLSSLIPGLGPILSPLFGDVFQGIFSSLFGGLGRALGNLFGGEQGPGLDIQHLQSLMGDVGLPGTIDDVTNLVDAMEAARVSAQEQAEILGDLLLDIAQRQLTLQETMKRSRQEAKDEFGKESFKDLQQQAKDALKDGIIDQSEIDKIKELGNEEAQFVFELIKQRQERKKLKQQAEEAALAQEELLAQLGEEAEAINNLTTNQGMFTTEIWNSVAAAEQLMTTLGSTSGGMGGATGTRMAPVTNQQNVNISGNQTIVLEADGRELARVTAPFLDEDTQGNFTRQNRNTIRQKGGIR